MPDDFSQQETAGGASDPSAPAVRRIGDFEIVRELGRGGMGIVFEARQISLKRNVAIKLLPPGLGFTDKAIARFRREAQAAARLHHTNIVPVYATGEEAGSHYYVMELVEGQSFAEVLRDLRHRGSNALLESTVGGGPAGREGGVPASGAPSTSHPGTSAAEARQWFDAMARLVAEVAEGLNYAHGQGIVHRDIKPANLMLSKDGRLCITDFGLALVTQEPAMTMSGLLVGSPAYMSPEQVAAGRVTVDHRTDVYSLGVVLYETLTGRLPFPGETREAMLTAILAKEPTRPRRFNPRVPLDLETICLKAMEKDPDRRYASAGEMAADLRRFLQRGLIAARRAGPLRRAGKAIRRNPAVVAATVAVLLLGAAGAHAWVLSSRSAEERAAKAMAEARLAMDSGDRREALAHAETALALDPGRIEAHLIRARSLVELDRAPEAVSEARRLLDEDPANLAARLILVRAAGSIPGMSQDEEERRLNELASARPQSADLDYFRSLLTDSQKEAVQDLDRALERDPAHLEALGRRASLEKNLKRFPEALSDCDRLITARPRDAGGRRRKAEVLLAMGEDGRALAELDRAIDLDRGDAASYRLRGRQFCRGDRKSLEASFRDLDEAIRLEPRSGRAYESRAWCNLMFLRYERAIDDARRAIELGADREYLPGAYIHLCTALHGLGRVPEARDAAAQLEKAISSWPDRTRRASAYQSLWQILHIVGDLEGARAAATRSIEASPTWGGYISRAIVLRPLKDEEGVRSDCRAAQEIPLDEPDALYSRGNNLRGTCGLGDAAIADYDRAFALAPAWGLVVLERGWTKIQARRIEEGLADYDRAIQISPRMLRAYNSRGFVLQGLGRWEESLRDFDAAIALGPNRFAYCSRSKSLFALGRIREAKAAIERCLQDVPDANTTADLALYEAHLGQRAEADAHFQRAVEIDPRSASVRIRLAEFEATQGHCDAATRELQAARDIGVSDPGDKENLAWILVSSVHRRCPRAANPAEALRLARESLEPVDWRAPRVPYTLAMAFYRNALYGEARSRLDSQGAGSDVEDRIITRLLQAMIEWRTGRKAHAVIAYRSAQDAIEHSEFRNAMDLLLLRDEAAELLGLRDEP